MPKRAITVFSIQKRHALLHLRDWKDPNSNSISLMPHCNQNFECSRHLHSAQEISFHAALANMHLCGRSCACQSAVTYEAIYSASATSSSSSSMLATNVSALVKSTSRACSSNP